MRDAYTLLMRCVNEIDAKNTAHDMYVNSSMSSFVSWSSGIYSSFSLNTWHQFFHHRCRNFGLFPRPRDPWNMHLYLGNTSASDDTSSLRLFGASLCSGKDLWDVAMYVATGRYDGLMAVSDLWGPEPSCSRSNSSMSNCNCIYA